MEICEVSGCNKSKRRSGPKTKYCHMHYRRFRLYGDAGTSDAKRVRSYNGKTCKIIGCNETALKKEMCAMHYDSERGSKLSAQEIDNMKKNGCMVCGSFDRLTLDHDHSCCPTGKSCRNCVRGILCHKCNTAAGLLNDNPDIMLSLATYILKNKDVLNYA